MKVAFATANLKIETFRMRRRFARVFRRRRRSYAPTSNTASPDNYEKINSWVSFCFPYEYGAPLDMIWYDFFIPLPFNKYEYKYLES